MATTDTRPNQREHILDVALKLMSERGAAGMSMRQLASACGVQVAAMFRPGGGTCQTATCSDSTKNGAETDVDCGGGTCPACTAGADCGTGSDCNSGVCTSNVCAVPGCNDNVQNQGESDVDCGGACGSTCANGRERITDRQA